MGGKAAKFLDYFVDEVYHLDSEATGYGYLPHYRVADPMTQHYYLDPYNVEGLYLLPTYLEGVAVCLESNSYDIASENEASLIDFRDGKQKIIYSNHTGFEDPYDSNHDKYDEIAKDIYRHVFSESLSGEGVNQPFSAYVYNIEVEDYHTYFVGSKGIWVHTQGKD